MSPSRAGPDVNQVLEECRKQGAFTLGLTNEADSPMTKVVDECWLVHSGKERSVAATKTYTGQLMLFYLLAWALGGRLQNIPRLADSAAHALRLRPRVGDLVDRYRF